MKTGKPPDDPINSAKRLIFVDPETVIYPAVSFFVPGDAQTAGSKTAYPFRKSDGSLGVAVTDSCARSAEWKAFVGFVARSEYKGPLLPGPLCMTLDFVRSRPRSHLSKTGEVRSRYEGVSPIAKPDVLKQARAVEDALTGIAYADDAQIIFECITKRYANAGETPGVAVRVWQKVGCRLC